MWWYFTRKVVKQWAETKQISPQFEVAFCLPAQLQHELVHIKLPSKYFLYLSLMNVHVGSGCVFPKTHSSLFLLTTTRVIMITLAFLLCPKIGFWHCKNMRHLQWNLSHDLAKVCNTSCCFSFCLQVVWIIGLVTSILFTEKTKERQC